MVNLADYRKPRSGRAKASFLIAWAQVAEENDLNRHPARPAAPRLTTRNAGVRVLRAG